MPERLPIRRSGPLAVDGKELLLQGFRFATMPELNDWLARNPDGQVCDVKHGWDHHNTLHIFVLAYVPHP